MGASQTKPTMIHMTTISKHLAVRALENELAEFKNENKRITIFIHSIIIDPSGIDFQKLEKAVKHLTLVELSIHKLKELLDEYNGQ
jgi:hypothetical protein